MEKIGLILESGNPFDLPEGELPEGFVNSTENDTEVSEDGTEATEDGTEATEDGTEATEDGTESFTVQVIILK